MAEKQKIAEVAVKHLKELQIYLQDHHKTLLIYISPTQAQAMQQEAADPILQALFKQYDLPVVYLKDRLAMHKEEVPKLFHDVIHLSPQGHHVWGEIMAQDLTSLSLQGA